MSGPFGSSQWMYASGGFYPYEIEQSLRFNDDDSAYLSRTPAGAGNRKTWTWSGWVKRGNLGSAQTLLGANTTFVEFISADKIQFDHNGTTVATSAVFRDPSAWYHVVVAVDTTQATAADRTEIYVNGTIQAVTGSYVSQNTDTDVNDATQHNIGANLTPAEYFDGYMAEVNFIDGSALDPTSFGEFKSDIWVPKKYTGSYGTNGFYLSFADSANIGDDLSGNGNDWTANNLVSTDVLLDSPTNNFAVLNRVSPLGATLNQGNLGYTTGTSTQPHIGSFVIPDSGKWYWEVYVSAVGEAMIGVQSTENLAYSAEKTAYYRQGGASNGIYIEGSTVAAAPASYTNGDIISVLLDCDGSTIDWYKNGVSQTSGESLTYVNGLVPILIQAAGSGSNSGVINFGQDSSFAGNKTAQGNTDANGQGDFYYAPPSGYLALNTANLPDPAIDPAVDDVPADYFNTVLYTGTGAAQSITGVGFQPDWTWIKGRSSGAQGHRLVDAVRGAPLSLKSHTTDAEFNDVNALTAFGSDGFDLGTLTDVNGSGSTYVAWNWLAGNGTSSNTDGSITSTVSVNQKAGFSVVGYTGTGANATVGHGLGAAPSMVIVKNRDQADAWQVYHGANTANPETDYLVLNTTAATADAADRWNDTLPTSSVFSLGNGATVNTNTEDYIAYCFAEVEGFSKFGSYTGNGSTDGPFVYTGFRPAFVMVKKTSGTGNWPILDNKRDPENAAPYKYIYPNLSNAEISSATADYDFLSNGFKLRNTTSDNNTSGGTYIFAAFAEQPVKYSLAR
jgi:hypothetical protein